MDSLDGLLEQSGKRNIEGAPNFNDFDDKDQNAIIWVYKIKKEQHELGDADELRALDECAILYRAQKTAFEDVIAGKGFSAVPEVPRDYSGRIAFLTHHGTFVVLGKYKNNGRHIAMSRIHSPSYNMDGSRAHIVVDMEIGNQPELTNYKGSELRALAINPNGADGDELEDCASIATSMSMKTAMFYINETDHPIKTVSIPAKKIKEN
jgi:hypothetical protein